MRRLTVAPAALVVALALAACTSESRTPDDGAGAGPASDTPTTAPPASSSAAPEAATPAAPGPITLAFAGDVHFEGVLGQRLGRPGTALTPVPGALADADLAVVNLETSVGAGGRPDPDKRFTFQAPASAFRALAAAGIDVASMANNHALDYGRVPLPGTFAAIGRVGAAEPPLHVVGLGDDAEEAFAPALADVDGTVVATLGATIAGLDPTADFTGDWAATATSAGTADAIDPTRLLRAVRRADRTSDVVVVYVHWGVQGESCPNADQRSLAADLTAAGADVIVGSHAHRLQGDGRLRARGREAYVAYGLGNFAWYTQDATTARTGVLTLTVRPPADQAGAARVTRAVWAPARIGPDGLPRALPPRERSAFEAAREDLRACSGLTR